MKHRKIGNVMTGDVVRAVHTTPFKEVAALLAQHRIAACRSWTTTRSPGSSPRPT
jgi:hypothetical protein